VIRAGDRIQNPESRRKENQKKDGFSLIFWLLTPDFWILFFIPYHLFSFGGRNAS
jgi:hypothetical protein